MTPAHASRGASDSVNVSIARWWITRELSTAFRTTQLTWVALRAKAPAPLARCALNAHVATRRALERLSDAIAATLARRYPGTRWHVSPLEDRAAHSDAPPVTLPHEPRGRVGIIDGEAINPLLGHIGPAVPPTGVHRDDGEVST